MKKRLLSILIALAMCLSLLPVTALAADPAEQFPGLTPARPTGSTCPQRTFRATRTAACRTIPFIGCPSPTQAL